MKFDQLQHRIARAETVLEGRQQQMQTQWTTLQRVWREGWTPLRIVAVGVGAGFLAGRAEPALKFVGPPREKGAYAIGFHKEELACAKEAFDAASFTSRSAGQLRRSA